MRHRVVLNEASAAHKSYHFRPQDPVWAPTGLLESVRKRLREFDSGISVWWSSTRRIDDPEVAGRWRVVQWMERLGNWTTVFYWEGESGAYLEPNATGIINRLQRARRPLEDVDSEVDAHNKTHDQKRRKELADAQKEYADDLTARRYTSRQTFAPGYIRRRFVKPEDLMDTNHSRFVREHEKKWGGGS